MTRVRLTVTNRKGVFNPEGKVIFNGLKRLGHHIDQVEVGKTFILTFPGDDRAAIEEDVKKICHEFLVNPVLEDYGVEFLED